MAITDATIERLRTAATAGDPDAACELGRLLCMLRSDSLEHLMDPDFVLTWPEERWLRAALGARPGDRPAAPLLAGRLVQQIAYWKIDDDHAEAHGEDERTLARRRDEAYDLYARMLETDPDDPLARAGIGALNAWADDAEVPDEPAFSYYELTLEMASGSFSHTETVVTTHADEVRWACSWLLAPIAAEADGQGPPFGTELTLCTYTEGRQTDHILLDEHLTTGASLEWDAVEIPPLRGALLPAGSAVGTRHYGYSCDWG